MAKTPGRTEAKLGDLVVRLLLDPSGLVDGGKKGGKEIKSFADLAKRNFEGITRASKYAVGTLTAVAFAVARFSAQATQIKNMSTQLGITTEQFTELRSVAVQLNVPMEALTASFTRLNVTIGQLNTDAITPGTAAIKALGIAFKDADGNLRSSADVFADIADKFASFEDGAAKSALAVQLFGEQGTKLLPVLNQGSEGLKKLGDEGKRLGMVLDEETIDKASQVDREFKKLGEQFSATAIKISGEFLPALQSLSRWMNDPETIESIKKFAGYVNTIITALERFDKFSTGNPIGDYFKNEEIEGLDSLLDGLLGKLGRLENARDDALAEGLDTSDIQSQIRAVEINVALLREKIRELRGETQDLPELQVTPFPSERARSPAPTVDPRDEAEAKARLEEIKASAQSAQQSALQDLMDSPTDTATTKLEALGEALKKGTISWQEFGHMSKLVGEQQEQVFDDLLSTASQTISALFKDSKTAAIASSLINTYQGITKALSAYPPPYNIAMAAMVAAQGFAQVQNIRNTSKSTTSGSSGGGGGGAGGGAGGGDGGGDDGGGNLPRTLFVQGINPTDLYTGKVVGDLAQLLLQYQRDGGTVLLDRKNS